MRMEFDSIKISRQWFTLLLLNAIIGLFSAEGSSNRIVQQSLK